MRPPRSWWWRSFLMILGLLLALASALATNVAFLFKYRGAVLVAPISVRHPLRSAAALFHSKWFVVGWLVAILAWVLHAGALARAPLSIVQAVLSGGLVFLAVLAERFFGLRVRPQPPARAGRRGDRLHLCGREPVRGHRRDPRLRRAHRLRPTRGARRVAFCLVIAGAALMPSQHAEQPDTSTPPIKGTA
ncbi:MAG: hypothetical protein ACXVHX_18170 [Solirubrobacteraceae bacterium]